MLIYSWIFTCRIKHFSQKILLLLCVPIYYSCYEWITAIACVLPSTYIQIFTSNRLCCSMHTSKGNSTTSRRSDSDGFQRIVKWVKNFGCLCKSHRYPNRNHNSIWIHCTRITVEKYLNSYYYWSSNNTQCHLPLSVFGI